MVARSLSVSARRLAQRAGPERLTPLFGALGDAGHPQRHDHPDVAWRQTFANERGHAFDIGGMHRRQVGKPKKACASSKAQSISIVTFMTTRPLAA